MTYKTDYQACGGADALWQCRADEILYDGPAGTGKTRAVCEKADGCARRWDGCRILFLRKTRASMTQSVLVTYEEKVLGPRSPIKSGAKRRTRESYEYSNGSTIVCGGLDNLGTMATGTPDDCAREVADAIDQAGGRPIMIAPGCTFDPLKVPAENLHAIRRAVEDVA